MVNHIILWTLNPELTAEEKAEVKKGIKEGLEGLQGKVPGLVSIKVNVDGRLDSSNCDVMLDSTLESAEALKAYATHPAHVAVADTKVRPYTVQRVCLDFEEENPFNSNHSLIKGKMRNGFLVLCLALFTSLSVSAQES